MTRAEWFRGHWISRGSRFIKLIAAWWLSGSPAMNNPFFIKHHVIDHRSPFRREDEVDAAVAGLKCARVSEVSFAFADVAA